ncbi:unnamed protein product [Darwinula stevensoni]|uniref:SAM domain-containing protein n=1 Tax=Darwinula stevensoni TaxID=69355 RepID=A0A7R9AI47_9CRUS|nr:unnamed protein product [Darwinula stevensoni]CAG0906016.1 unnamed protein product [Darwinula stevensoni]
MPSTSSSTRRLNSTQGSCTTGIQGFVPFGMDPSRSPRQWGPDEVEQWLQNKNLTMHCSKFRKHDIRGKELLELKRRDLKKLGIKRLGHIIRIEIGIKELKHDEKQFIDVITGNSTNNHFN